MSRRAWTLCIAGLVLSSLAALLRADHGIVVTKDGSTYEGDVREGDNSVVVVIRGIETVIPRADIERIDYGDFEKDFRDQLAKLGETDVAGRIALARSAFDRRRYDLARQAIADAQRIDPNSRDAADMMELIDRTQRLERSSGAQPAAAPAAPAEPAAPPRDDDTAPAPPRGAAPAERRLLSTEDINTIRQKELKPTDSGVRITFQGDVKKRFAEQQNIRFAEFNRLAPVEQAMQILDDGDEDMRRQVRITSDPSALAEYKRSVQPVVLSGCATTACHGGPAGGGLILYAPADSDPVAYTNFYILTQFESRTAARSNQGIFGSAMRKLVERGHGHSSLLANYGLPTTIAEFDHPPVGGKAVQPIFRNKSDSRYEQVIRWMDQTLARIEPDYKLDFPLPRGAGAGAGATGAVTQPATEPSR